ncbi:MAG: hypothetical protein ACE5EC_00045 [Phycisphaerae bacterium]
MTPEDTAKLTLERASQYTTRHFTRFAAFGNICAIVLPSLTLFLGGCGMDAAMKDSARLTKIQALEDKVAAQTRLLVQKDEQLRDQAEMIQSLQNLPRGLKLADLIHVDRIDIANLSGGYDDDGDGIDDGVRVYLQPSDQHGGALRATGKVHVRLYDLNNPPESQSVGEIKLEPEELAPLWYGRFLTSHYTLKVPWSAGAKSAPHRKITVVATFTDLLSGRSFETQALVEVSIGPIASAP